MPYSKLVVQKIGDLDDKAIWELHEPFEWTNGVIKVIVPQGFQCDFASIPQFALSILGECGVPWWKRYAMYKAVRMFAGSNWHKRKVNEPFMEEYVL